MTRINRPNDAQTAQPRFTEAKRRNAVLQGEGRNTAAFGAAKPVIVFDGEKIKAFQ